MRSNERGCAPSAILSVGCKEQLTNPLVSVCVLIVVLTSSGCASTHMSRSSGGGVGITAATRRNHSSSILRRIGGRALVTDGVELPHYYDPQYTCEMEILRFESELPNPRYEVWIEEIRAHLQTATVVRCKHSSVRRGRALEPIDVPWGEQTGVSQ